MDSNPGSSYYSSTVLSTSLPTRSPKNQLLICPLSYTPIKIDNNFLYFNLFIIVDSNPGPCYYFSTVSSIRLQPLPPKNDFWSAPCLTLPS